MKNQNALERYIEITKQQMSKHPGQDGPTVTVDRMFLVDLFELVLEYAQGAEYCITVLQKSNRAYKGFTERVQKKLEGDFNYDERN